jgi:hypothetical protein
MISRPQGQREIYIMDEISGDRLIALASQGLEGAGALWSIALVTDTQLVSTGSYPLASVLQKVGRLRRQEAGQVVLESCLPEIRCVAMLSAASRQSWDGGGSPEHFTDEADWLAARIQILALSHVEVALQQMSLLELANQRVQQMCTLSGVRAVQALPVLLTRPLEPGHQMLLRGWSRIPLDAIAPLHQPLDMGSKVAQALRQRCRERLAVLLAARSAGGKKTGVQC